MKENRKRVSIDFHVEGAFPYLDHDAIVCIDVIQASTTLVTAVATGRRVFAAASFEQAMDIASDLKDPLIAGADERPSWGRYEVANSPRALNKREDVWRPMVLVSSYGAQLQAHVRGGKPVFVACLRNLAATAELLATGYRSVAVIGPCSSDGLRCEDQFAAARLGAMLCARGFEPDSRGTADTIRRWSTADLQVIRLGRSAEQLRLEGAVADLEFIMSHVEDLDFACENRGAEVGCALSRAARLRSVSLAREA